MTMFSLRPVVLLNSRSDVGMLSLMKRTIERRFSSIRIID